MYNTKIIRNSCRNNNKDLDKKTKYYEILNLRKLNLNNIKYKIKYSTFLECNHLHTSHDK